MNLSGTRKSSSFVDYVRQKPCQFDDGACGEDHGGNAYPFFRPSTARGSALFGLVDQALILERRPGGNTSQRTLRALGRYSESPSEVVLDYQPYEYRLLGAIADVDREAQSSRVWTVLSNEPQSIPAIPEAAALTERQARVLLKLLEEQGRVRRDGGGVKNDPYSNRRAASDSFPADPHPKGKGKHQTGLKRRIKPGTAAAPSTGRRARSRA